jgi:hypothetical protein
VDQATKDLINFVRRNDQDRNRSPEYRRAMRHVLSWIRGYRGFTDLEDMYDVVDGRPRRTRTTGSASSPTQGRSPILEMKVDRG